MARTKRAATKKKKATVKEKKPLRQKPAPENPEPPKPVQISAAKGRPMLVWAGKKSFTMSSPFLLNTSRASIQNHQSQSRTRSLQSAPPKFGRVYKAHNPGSGPIGTKVIS